MPSEAEHTFFQWAVSAAGLKVIGVIIGLIFVVGVGAERMILTQQRNNDKFEAFEKRISVLEERERKSSDLLISIQKDVGFIREKFAILMNRVSPGSGYSD